MSMSLMHPSSVGAPVAVWFVNGMPARVVHAATRYRVIDTAQPTDRGWTFRVRADSGQEHTFEVSVCRDGWELVSAS
jgi:hypothetical protein